MFSIRINLEILTLKKTYDKWLGNLKSKIKKKIAEILNRTDVKIYPITEIQQL